MEKEGGWIFISHSHMDIEIVRQIRNKLEGLGFEPLLFYLKCLSDKDEIEGLIQREIDEREWFIYVDSPNASKSKWVQSEREYIAQLQGKKVFTIHVDQDIDEQIDFITKQLKVYISYPHYYEPICKEIRRKLIENEFLVLCDNALPVGGRWRETIDKNIEIAARDGFVLLLVGERNQNSAWVRMEIEKAASVEGKIVPVYIGDAALAPELIPLVGECQGVHIDDPLTEEQLDKIVREIEHRIKYYKNDFTMQYGFQGAVTIRYPYISIIPDYAFTDCDRLQTVYIPACVTEISDKAFAPNQDVLIVCKAGSYAERYCKSKGMRFLLSDDV